MSLEIAVQENTAAIRDLIAALKSGTPVTPAQVAAVVAEAPAEDKVVKDPVVRQEAPAATDLKPVTLDELRAICTRLVKKDRTKLVDLLAEFKIPNISAADPAQYTVIAAAARTALGETAEHG